MIRLLALTALAAIGCAPDLPRSLGDQCDLDSDCETPLVCGYGFCRTECTTSRDCALGIDCIFDNRQRGVCQFTDETMCTLDSDCPDELTCTFGECTNSCDDCVEGMPCRNCPAGASCVTRDDGVTRGCLDPATQACTHNSNCDVMTDAICAGDQRCRVACQSNADCRLGDICETTTITDGSGEVAGTFCVGPGVTISPDAGTADGGVDAGTDGG